MKKIIFATAIATLLAAPQAFAQAKYFEGLSVGGNLNLIATTTEVSSYVSKNSLNGIGQQATNAALQAAYSFASSDAVVVSVGGTYNLGEVDAGAISDRDGSVSTFKLKNYMSIYVEPGIVANKTNLLYTKLSYNLGTLKGDVGTTPVTKDITGAGFGFGVRTLLSKEMFLQVEVNRVQFGSVRFEDITSDFKSSATIGSVGLGYKF
jgi:outer membrane immunogenic protein